MKTKLNILCLLISIPLFSQKKEVIYEVDGILIDPVFYEQLNDLNDSIVHRYNTIEDELIIEDLGYANAKRLIQIYTTAFVHRPDSLKQIPSTKAMERIEGKWHLEGKPQAYTGAFRDYYLSGNIQGKGSLVEGKLEGKRYLYNKDGSISDVLNYKNGFPEGKEIRYYADGTIKQIGYYKAGYEVGEWKKFHPNGELKQTSNFSDEGKLNGEVKTYYSTGKLKGISEFADGKLVEDRQTYWLTSTYETGKKNFQLGKFNEAIKLFTKCIQAKPTWNDAYFARGTAYLNHYEFEKALADFNQAIAIEPLDAFAYTNRAFVLIRKQEYKNAREISSTKGIQVFGTNKVKIPQEDLEKICRDLQKAKALGDENRMLLDAYTKYCE